MISFDPFIFAAGLVLLLCGGFAGANMALKEGRWAVLLLVRGVLLTVLISLRVG